MKNKDYFSLERSFGTIQELRKNHNLNLHEDGQVKNLFKRLTNHDIKFFVGESQDISTHLFSLLSIEKDMWRKFIAYINDSEPNFKIYETTLVSLGVARGMNLADEFKILFCKSSNKFCLVKYCEIDESKKHIYEW